MALIKTNARSATALDATILTGNIPALNGSAVTNLTSGNLTGALPAISGASLTTLNATNISSGTLNAARYSGGKVLQIKNLHSTASTATSSSSYTATALDLSITPTSASSKIIIHCSTNTDNEASGRQAEVGLWRETGGDGATNTVIGGNSQAMASYGVSSRIVTSTGFVYLDSPATTSVVRYRVVIKSNTSNQVLFGAYMGSNSTIILQEVTV